MREIITKVFSYAELSDESQKKAVGHHFDVNVDEGWSEPVIEDFVTKLEELGYSNVETQFSGFSCQGDGACFKADIDITAIGVRLTERKASFFNMLKDVGTSIEISERHCGNYVHENTKTIAFDYVVDELDHPRVFKFITDLEETLEEERYALCKELYSNLNKEYDYWVSDEQIATTLKDNPDNYEFTEDGAKY